MDERITAGAFSIRRIDGRWQLYHNEQLRLAVLDRELPNLVQVVMEAEFKRLASDRADEAEGE